MKTNKVWYVTGASKGLGLSLVKQLIKDGYNVAATSRTTGDLAREVGSPSNFLAMEVNLSDEDSVQASIAQTLKKFGTIDVVVNNAGYGQLGTLEETSDDEARLNYEVNVFGSLNVIRSVMSHFREKGSGHVINISSIAGFEGSFAGWGIYNSTKFAVTGFTEALAVEAKSLGIKATIVYPGYFKTNFLKQGSLLYAKEPIAAYKEARELEVIHEKQIVGNQPGDPEKAATAFIKLAETENPPLHFFMGSDSFNMAKAKIEALQNELMANEAFSKSTDFTK